MNMEEPRKERKICCCLISHWTMIIAVLQTMWFILGLGWFIYGYIQFKQKLNPNDENEYPLRNFVILGGAIIPGILMGFILFWGSLRRIPCNLTLWTLHAILCVILYTIMAAVNGTILVGIFRTGVIVLAIWVVQVTKGEFDVEEENKEHESQMAKRVAWWSGSRSHHM